MALSIKGMVVRGGSSRCEVVGQFHPQLDSLGLPSNSLKPARPSGGGEPQRSPPR
jgi:hypothetical protein